MTQGMGKKRKERRMRRKRRKRKRRRKKKYLVGERLRGVVNDDDLGEVPAKHVQVLDVISVHADAVLSEETVPVVVVGWCHVVDGWLVSCGGWLVDVVY